MEKSLQEFTSDGWKEEEKWSYWLHDFNEGKKFNFDVDISVLKNSGRVNSILLYSHTTWTFETQKDVDIYLWIFIQTINYISKKYSDKALYYIQNYEWFDPTKFIDEISTRTKLSPLKETLELLPFKNQRSVCSNVPKIIQRKMPGVIFNHSIEDALDELNLIPVK